jgi:hypothetical protein
LQPEQRYRHRVVLAAGRAYSSAKKATRAARSRHVARGTFGRRCFAGCFTAGVIVLGGIGLASPAQFGQPGASTLRTGWPSIALLVLVVGGLLLGVARRRRLVWLLDRVREPYVRPLEDHAGYDDAVDALQSCPAALRTRYAISWVWGPMAWAVLGCTFAFSAAYFLVDAILARGRIGWAQPLYAIGFALLSWGVFGAAAGRLTSWRFAASVHKEATTGYPA